MCPSQAALEHYAQTSLPATVGLEQAVETQLQICSDGPVQHLPPRTAGSRHLLEASPAHV